MNVLEVFGALFLGWLALNVVFGVLVLVAGCLEKPVRKEINLGPGI